MVEKPIVTRESLRSGEIERLLHSGQNGQKIMSDEERLQLVEDTLRELGKNQELWVFGYGSLIWNPALEYEEQRRCLIQGYQKKFCFWTTLGRGSKDQPGLMMGLIKGDYCNGVSYRINPDKALSELDILFRREMLTFVYKPTWVTAHCVETNTDFTALTFVVDPDNHRYVDSLTLTETVRIIAMAEGPLGRNCDYLFQLSQKLHEYGFEEPELNELVTLVKQFQADQ